MKPREIKPDIVYRIINREDGFAKGSYSRACCDEYYFNSVGEARSVGWNGIFEDETNYKIAKYKVVHELINDDVQEDPNEKQRRIEHFRQTIGGAYAK